MPNHTRFSLRPLLRASLMSAAVALLLSACGGNDHDLRLPGQRITTSPHLELSPAMVAEIDDYVLAQLRRQHIPGMSVVVARNGTPVLQKGYGTANLATGEPVTPDMAFRIGSVTKQFTASAIMMLVQDGRLTLDQPLAQLLPTAPASWKDITVRHLLTHTSGLPRDLPMALLARIDPAHLPSIDQLVAMTGELPLAYPTGSAQVYSNIGYHLLGFVIEKASGQHYAQFLRQRVFQPLGMGSADVIQSSRPGAKASGYSWDGTALKPATTFTLTPGLVEAEGGLQMSGVDLAKWDAVLEQGRFIRYASLVQMWTPARLNDGSSVPYGFGWALDEINHRPVMQHDGLVEGFTSQYAHHPQNDLAVIVLANSDHAQTQRVVSRIRAIIDPSLDYVTTADPHPQTGELLRTVMDESARGVLRADQRFAPAFQEMMTSEMLESFTAYLSQWGTIEKFGYLDQVTIRGMPVARYLVRSRYEQAVIGIALDGQGRIVLLDLLGE